MNRLLQRGLSEAEAMSLSVNGFINDLVKEFPMEYSVELKRLIDQEMEGSGVMSALVAFESVGTANPLLELMPFFAAVLVIVLLWRRVLNLESRISELTVSVNDLTDKVDELSNPDRQSEIEP